MVLAINDQPNMPAADACLRCGGTMTSMGVEKFRVGGTSGGWQLLFGSMVRDAKSVSRVLAAAAILAVASATVGCGATHRAAGSGRASYSRGQVKAAFAAEGIQLSKYGGHVQPPRGIVYLVSGMGVSVTVWIGHQRPSKDFIADTGWRRAHQGNLTLAWDSSLNRAVRAALRRLT